MPNFQTFALYSAATTTALMAGLFYAYSCSVNPGLHRLPDVAYLSAMQSINRAILNPVFFICFLGAPASLPLSTWHQYGQPVTLRFWLLLAATSVYVVGVFGVTMFCNVPLNNALDAFSIENASVAQLSEQRSAFELPWNRWHSIRTIASVIALMLVLGACLAAKEE
ncbi:DUF1772 domain-containing protein [Spirosoma sp. BT702]|uniref:DUF1772 domain-containing protein n=1 Tax=Spirosoma profusum TaxID=2771354 RepID=A0A926Y389_9BACT|nr:anthrone oxygenase family protein [Spirosoma profusum]MBD2701630.1 DUF1772 domain-containing protein [Spirosoma profusum]